MYRFILYNHEPEDELFFFGFSRGAFTVRSLTGFIKRYGLVRKNDDYYVPEMYQCYERGVKPGEPQFDSVFVRPDGTKRIERVRDCPPIKFIGVWDTVGALGAPGLLGQLFNSKRYRYHDVDLNDSIQNAVHALALQVANHSHRRSGGDPTGGPVSSSKRGSPACTQTSVGATGLTAWPMRL